MKCSRPYRQGVVEYGCGQCLPCRINRQRVWSARLLLESRLHAYSYFVTLTYSDEPVVDAPANKRDVQLFLKRLRKQYKLRYYLVSELGSKTKRLHYHMIAFSDSMIPDSSFADAWGKGFVYVGSLTVASVRYVTGYIFKQPLWQLMSRRPAIGRGVIDSLDPDTLRQVTPVLLVNGRPYSIGRTLMRRVRELLTGSPRAPDDVMLELSKRALMDYRYNPRDVRSLNLRRQRDAENLILRRVEHEKV